MHGNPADCHDAGLQARAFRDQDGLHRGEDRRDDDPSPVATRGDTEPVDAGIGALAKACCDSGVVGRQAGQLC